MPAGGGHAGVVQRRDHHVQMRTGGAAAVLGVVACPFQIVQAGCHQNVAGEAFGRVRERRQPIEQEVQRRRGSAQLDVLHLAVELGAQPGRAHQPEEGAARIGARHHATGGDFLSAGQHHTGSDIVFHQNAFHLGPGANFGAASPRRRDQGLGKRTDATPHEGRGANTVSVTARGVVQHAEGAAHGARTLTGSRQRAAAEQSLEGIAGEPVVEEVPGRERQDAQQLHQVALAEFPRLKQGPEQAQAFPGGRVVQDGRWVGEGDP